MESSKSIILLTQPERSSISDRISFFLLLRTALRTSPVSLSLMTPSVNSSWLISTKVALVSRFSGRTYVLIISSSTLNLLVQDTLTSLAILMNEQIDRLEFILHFCTLPILNIMVWFEARFYGVLSARANYLITLK